MAKATATGSPLSPLRVNIRSRAKTGKKPPPARRRGPRKSRGRALFVTFEAPVDFDDGDVSVADAAVFDYWYGSDPGATVDLNNKLEFIGAEGDYGIAIWDSTLGVYKIVQMMCTASADLEIPDPFLISDGSAAAPSLAFTTDTDTGFYKSAANELAIAIGGVKKAVINSAGIKIFSAFSVDTFNGNRILVSSGDDIAEAAALTNGQLLIGSTGAAPVAATLTAGANVTITPGAGSITIASTGGGGSGTVTSVALSLPTALFDISGSPVTTSGTLTATLDNQTANTIFAGPTTGAAATPAFRSLVAADIPTHTHAAADVTSGVFAIARLATGTPDGTKFVRDDGTLAVPSATASAHNLLSASHSDTVTGTPASGDLIVGNGTPAWERLPAHTTSTRRFLVSRTVAGIGATEYQAIVAADLAGVDHSALVGITTGDAGHTQFALLAGRATPQTIAFGTASGASTGHLTSTNHATKGKYFLNAAHTITIDDLNTRFGFGTDTPDSLFHVVSEITGTARGFTFGQHNAGAHAALFLVQKSRGTKAAPAAVVNSDQVFSFIAQGYDGNSYEACASFTFVVDGVVSDGVVPTSITFNTGTTAAGITEKLRVPATGPLRTQAGTAGLIARIGGVINSNITAASNSAGAETDLLSYSVPANVLAADKDSLRFVAAGTFAATANTKQLKVKFGATTIFDAGALAISAATDWSLEGEVIRTGATAQKAIVRLSTSSGTLTAYADYSAPAETLSGAVTLKITGTATGAADITAQFWKIYWEPAET